MGDAKYGRLFTEEDVKELIGAAVYAGIEIEHNDPTGSNPLRSDHFNLDAIYAALTTGITPKFPEEEPLFLLRGKDELAEDTIVHYESDAHASGCDENFLASVNAAREQFESFRRANPDRMKLPD